MIHANRIVTVGEQECIIDRPIVLYRGDREVEIEFTLVGNEFTFSEDGNVIKSVNASHGQLVLNTPSGEHMFSELAECHEGKVVFVVTKEMIDEFIEMGFYSFQIRLYDSAEMKSRVTIPPVMNGFDIRNPIAAEDETNVVDQGIVDYARIFKDQSNEELPTFDWTGAYNKTEWVHHDVITENKMNKIEDALYSINANIKESDVVMLNALDNVKKDADKYVKEHMAEVEADVEEFERNLNTGVEQFKIDTNAAMTAHKNEVSEELDGFSSQLADNTNDLVTIKPNGVDDTLQIQEKVLSGGVISFSKKGGVFRVNDTINIPSNVTIEGNGCKIICSKPICFYGENIENVTIKDLEFIGPGASIMGEKSTDGCISITQSNHITIDNCTIYDFFDGVSILYSNVARVTNNHIHTYHTYGVMLSRTKMFFCDNNEIHDTIVDGQTNGVYCISATGSSTSGNVQNYCSISNNKLYNNEPWSAIMSHDISYLRISNNQIYNTRNGIDLSSEYENSNIIINNNIMIGTKVDSWKGVNAANDGILLYTGNGTDLIALKYITITGNHIEGFGRHYSGSQACGEILLSGVIGCNISGNTLIHYDGIAAYNAGIFVNYNVSDLNINGNYIKTQSKNGILLHNIEGSNINIVGNTSNCDTISTAMVEISNCNINNYNVSNNISNAMSYYERGTNIIDGISITAPYGGRGQAKHISMRTKVPALTVDSNKKVTLASVEVPGVRIGDTVSIGYGGIKPGLIVYGYVAGADLVVIEVYNTNSTTINSPEHTLTINAIKNH